MQTIKKVNTFGLINTCCLAIGLAILQ